MGTVFRLQVKKSEGFHKLKYMKGYIRSVKRAKRANDALYDCKGSRRNVLVLPDCSQRQRI